MQIHAEYILTQWIIETSDTVLRKIYPSLYCKVACERELETEQRLQNIDLPSPSRHHCVSFSFSWTAQLGAWGPSLSGTCSHSSIFSLTGLVSKLNRGSWGPLLLGGGFLYHILSPTHLISNSLTSCLTELYNSSIAHSIFGMACLISIKRK